MQALEVIALIVVTSAAALYLYRAYSAHREKQAQQRIVQQAFANTPERRIAELLGEARRTMPQEEYEKLKRETFAAIQQNNEQIRAKP
jgi:hypothetical protein